MKILKNSQIIIDDFVELNYFNNYKEVTKFYTTESYWKKVDLNLYSLTYNLSYGAKDPGGESYFIKYKRKLNLECQIDDINRAAIEIINIKQEMNNLLTLFLEQNVLNYLSLLEYEPVFLSEMNIEREIFSIEYAKNSYLLNKELNTNESE